MRIFVENEFFITCKFFYRSKNRLLESLRCRSKLLDLISRFGFAYIQVDGVGGAWRGWRRAEMMLVGEER